MSFTSLLKKPHARTWITGLIVVVVMVAGCGIWWAAYSNAKNAMTQKWAGTAATVADEATLLASHVSGLQTIRSAAQESETSPEISLVEQADAAIEEATNVLSMLTEEQESNEGLFTMTGHLGPADPSALFAAIPAHASLDNAQSSAQSADTGPQSGDRTLPDITVMAAELGYIETETTDIDEAQSGSQSGGPQSQESQGSIEFSPVDLSPSASMTQKDVDDLLRLSEDITTANNAVLNSAAALLTGTYQAHYETATTGLSTQQKALTDAVTKAEKTLKDSDGRVADPGTRDALKKAIDKAQTTTGKELPVLISDVKAATKETKEITDALTKATKAVTDSITAKQSATESAQAESTQYAGEQTSSDDYGYSYGSDDYQWDNSWNDYESNDYGWGGDSNSGGGGTSSPSGTTAGSSQGSSGGSQGGTPSGGGDDGSLFPDMCFITKPGSGEMIEVPC